MKTLSQFLEDAGSGYSDDYENERVERRKKNTYSKETRQRSCKVNLYVES